LTKSKKSTTGYSYLGAFVVCSKITTPYLSKPTLKQSWQSPKAAQNKFTGEHMLQRLSQRPIVFTERKIVNVVGKREGSHGSTSSKWQKK
jgi:hypothetical protein